MNLRGFRLRCTLRVVLITATLLVAFVLAYEVGAFVAAGIVGLAVMWQVAGLVRYVEKTSRDLERFLRSVRYADFSQAFSDEGRAGPFPELAAAFTEVMDDFRDARSETEAQERYLQTVVQHVGVGLVAFEADGTVSLVNNAAKRLLRVPHLKHTQGLRTFSPALVEALHQLEPGEKTLVQVADHDELLNLAIYAASFRLQGTTYKLVSIQNLQRELDDKEAEAWQKLTRVLTHEIMNSIAPIASLAETANDLLQDALPAAQGDGAAAEALDDVRGAMRTIERRSEGLLTFVQSYRQLTRIPKPNFQIVPLAVLFDDLERLLQRQLTEQSITLTTHIEPASLNLTADPEQIEQVLLNLLKNAAQALAKQDDAHIDLRAMLDERSRVAIQVRDNGPGIVPEALDKIFIPFYSTKKDGSGIGLSFSREIMRQHNGTIRVRSEPGQTVFTLRF